MTPTPQNNSRKIIGSIKSDNSHLYHNSKSLSVESKGKFKTPSSLLLKQRGGFGPHRFKTPSRPTKKSEISRSLLSVKNCSLAAADKSDFSNLNSSVGLQPKIDPPLKRNYISSLGNLNRPNVDLNIL